MNPLALYVDFNEMLEHDLVLLSKDDLKKADNGETVLLHEGAQVTVYMDDENDDGHADRLVATGTVERNPGNSFSPNVKWCCRIDKHGIRHQSEIDQGTH